MSVRGKGFVWTGAEMAARRVMEVVAGLGPLGAVVDIGCGRGTWLQAALAAGASRAVGLDAPYVDASMMPDGRIEFLATDLEQAIRLEERFDLAMSLEVAEHLTPRRADSFVDDLCRLSNQVLFSAAIPGQRGVNHINEQWHSFWAERFAARGYYPWDVVRPELWGNREIQPYYRQNIFLYLDATASERLLGKQRPPPAMLDSVVPDYYLRRPTIRQRLALIAEVPRLVLRKLGGGAPR